MRYRLLIYLTFFVALVVGIERVVSVQPAFLWRVREAQRHLVQFMLQPIAELVAQEASDKLGAKVSLDLVSPLQAFDQGGRDRMPVVLNRTNVMDWLTGAKGLELLKPAPEDVLKAWPVSRRVNSSKAPDEPTLIEPIELSL